MYMYKHVYTTWYRRVYTTLPNPVHMVRIPDGVYFTTTFAPEDTHVVSLGQYFKRSHGHGGLSYSREVAIRKTTRFSRPTEPVFLHSATHRSGLG